MKLTVLGSAAGYMPKDQPFRFSGCHLIEVADKKILFDAGIGAMPQLAVLGMTVHDLDAIVISHFHHDHFAIGPIMQSLFLEGKASGKKPKIKFIGPAGLRDACKTIFEVSFSFNDHFLANVDVEFLENEQEIELWPDVLLKSYKTKHFELEARASRLENTNKVFAYSGDSTDDKGLRIAAKNADVFLCESAVDIAGSNDEGHVNAFGAAKIAKETGVKKLVIVHYKGNDSDQAMIDSAKISGYDGEVSISKDMSSYEI